MRQIPTVEQLEEVIAAVQPTDGFLAEALRLMITTGCRIEDAVKSRSQEEMAQRFRSVLRSVRRPEWAGLTIHDFRLAWWATTGCFFPECTRTVVADYRIQVPDPPTSEAKAFGWPVGQSNILACQGHRHLAATHALPPTGPDPLVRQREQILQAFGVTEEDIEALDPDGSYARAHEQARRERDR